MLVVGIDQALTKSGFAIYETDKNSLHYGTYQTSSDKGLYRRIQGITHCLTEITEEFGTIDQLFTEQPFLFKTTSSAIKLIRVETAIHYYCEERSIPFTVVACNPRKEESWPRQLGLISTKTELLTKLRALGLKMNDHESDAIGVTLGGLTLLTGKLVDYSVISYQPYKWKSTRHRSAA